MGTTREIIAMQRLRELSRRAFDPSRLGAPSDSRPADRKRSSLTGLHCDAAIALVLAATSDILASAQLGGGRVKRRELITAWPSGTRAAAGDAADRVSQQPFAQRIGSPHRSAPR